LVRLHWQSGSSRSSARCMFSGPNPVPSWEPSQKGWFLDRPQPHHLYSPGPIFTMAGSFLQITGSINLSAINFILSKYSQYMSTGIRPEMGDEFGARPTGIDMRYLLLGTAPLFARLIKQTVPIFTSSFTPAGRRPQPSSPDDRSVISGTYKGAGPGAGGKEMSLSKT